MAAAMGRFRRATIRSLPPIRAEGNDPAGSLLALAYPERIAKNRGGGAGAFLLANGRGAQIDASLAARARAISCRRRVNRQRGRRPHPARRADHPRRDRGALCRPYRNARGDRVSMRRARACAARRLPQARRRCAFRAADAGRAGAMRAHTCSRDGIARLGIGRLPWSKALRQWRDRVMFLRAEPKATNGPTCPMRRWPQTVDEWLAPALAGKTALGRARRRRIGDGSARHCCRGRCSGGSTPRRRPISTAPTGTPRADRL